MTTHDRAQPQAWPRQLRLPGQAAAPEGPVDMQTMYLMHHAFRRDLDSFAAAVRAAFFVTAIRRPPNRSR